jgi:hypothetical protein
MHRASPVTLCHTSSSPSAPPDLCGLDQSSSPVPISASHSWARPRDMSVVVPNAGGTSSGVVLWSVIQCRFSIESCLPQPPNEPIDRAGGPYGQRVSLQHQRRPRLSMSVLAPRLLFLGLVVACIDCKPLAHVCAVCGLPVILGAGIMQHVRTRVAPHNLIGAAMRFGVGFRLVLLDAAP